MNKLIIPISLILVIIIVAALIASCSQETITQTRTVTTTTAGQNTTTTVTNTQTMTSTVTVTQPVTTTQTITTTQPQTTTTTTTATSPPITTAGELALMGSTVYNTSCIFECHGEWDIYGREEFAGHDWGFFDTAQEYFNFTKRFMPGNAPGSLSDQEYLEVIAFILTGLNKVQSEALFGLSNLSTFPLN